MSLPQGDVTAAQLEALADLALAYGDGAVRFGSDGPPLLRWVPDAEVPALFARLAAAGLGRDGAGSAADVVACPGADSCRLAVTRTRGIARLVEERVRARLGDAGLSARAPRARLRAARTAAASTTSPPSACRGARGSSAAAPCRSTSCSWAAAVGDGGASFGKLAGKVPARRVPEAVAQLDALYLAERRPGEAAGAVLRARRSIARRPCSRRSRRCGSRTPRRRTSSSRARATTSAPRPRRANARPDPGLRLTGASSAK